MCLEVYAVANANQIGDEALAQSSGLRIKKRDKPLKNAFYFSQDGGCSCSLLSDNADWNSKTWDLKPDILDGLAKAVKLLAKKSEGITFQALWMGDKPESTQKVSLKELLSDIKNNQIRNKHVYVVGKIKAE